MATVDLTFPDETVVVYSSGVTPAEIAFQISKSLGEKAISATVNGTHWDLQWPIHNDARIEIHTMQDDERALELIRHDLAHVMARAVQELWPDVKATIGPIRDHGWFYDFDKKGPFTSEDLKIIEERMREIIISGDPVRTEIWTREDALRYYAEKDETYKIELVVKIPDNEKVRMYWHGDWQDLCRGPHLTSTDRIPVDAFKLTHVAGAYWLGDNSRPMLQRIYGVAFKHRKGLKAHLSMLEEAASRDHRKLGRELNLFHIQEEARGQVFWHPNGWVIYTALQDYMRRKQRKGQYVEVNTPAVVDRRLWEESGHWDKYQDNMFLVEVDEEHAQEKAINALKPMNCPCHVQIFKRNYRSYRDLPVRMAEFGSCHRYEPSGSLHGLMRVRGFAQDDGHIFCTEEQIASETLTFTEFLSDIYNELGFSDFKVKFSDRPEKRAGTDEQWDKSDKLLRSAIESTGLSYEENPGEGAFYGPKLEFVLTDAIGREWQCGTFQVDFIVPANLDTTYIGKDGEKHHPVMLHRATLGSFERFIGILIEQYAGSFPLWLAPEQVIVASIVSNVDGYTEEIAELLTNKGLRVRTDLRFEKIGYKVREHSLKKIPIILAVGEKEQDSRTVSLRRFGEKHTSEMELNEFVDMIVYEALPPDLK